MRHPVRSLLALIVCVSALAVPAVAQADTQTVSVNTVPSPDQIVVFGGAGLNGITVVSNGAGSYIVSATTADTFALDGSATGAGCSAMSPDLFACPDSLSIKVLGGAGNDTIDMSVPGEIFGNGGNDLLYGHAGTQTIDGGDGTDEAWGGSGSDVFSDSGTTPGDLDTVNYNGEGRGVGVVASIDGVANDGTASIENDNIATSIEIVSGSEHDDTLTGNNGANTLNGWTGNDILDGGPGNDLLWGDRGQFPDGLDTTTGGNDDITGGAGADSSYGQGGNDTLRGRDGETDTAHHCGDGTDNAIIDATGDTAAPSCETIDRGSVAPPTSTTDTDGDGRADAADNCPNRANADQLDTDKDGRGDLCDPVLLASSYIMPKFTPVTVGTKVRFTSRRSAESALKKSGVNYRLQVREVGLASVAASYRAKIQDGDIVKQSPNAGVVIGWTQGQTPPLITFTVYDEEEDFKGVACNYLAEIKKPMLADWLRGRNFAEAKKELASRKCVYRVVNFVESKTVTDETILTANAVSTKTMAGRDSFFALTVLRPKRSDFAITVADRSRLDWKRVPAAHRKLFDAEIGIGTDGKLTAGPNPAVITLAVNEARTGRSVRSITIEVRKQDGRLLASTTTNQGGDQTFTIPVDWTGDLEIDVRVVRDTEVLEGWLTIPVVYRKRQPVTTLSGRRYTWKGDRYVPAPVPVKLTNPALNSVVDHLRATLPPLFAGAPNDLAKIQAAFGVTGQFSPEQQLARLSELGVLPSKTVSGGITDGVFDFAKITTATGFTVHPTGVIAGSVSAAQLPDRGDVGSVMLIGNDSAGLVGQDGGTLVGLDGGTLVGQDGGTLVGNDGASLIGNDSAGLVGLNGAPLISNINQLIGNDSGGLISNSANAATAGIGRVAGAAIISDKGSGFISDQGGGLVSRPFGLISDNGLGLVQVLT